MHEVKKLFNVAICDDDEQLCFQIENTLVDYGNKTSKIIKTEVFFSGEELCDYLKNGEFFDIIFLDIEMQPISGVETGLKIRDELQNNNIQIIFISSHSEYALELFKIRPMDFLIKPLKSEMMITAFEKYMDLFEKKVETFQYQIKHHTYKVLTSSILYFSSNNREVDIHFVDGKISTFYGALDNLYDELQQHKFIRIHRSYLVKYDKIKVFMNDKVQLINEELLPISRVKKKEVKELRKLLEKEYEELL